MTQTTALVRGPRLSRRSFVENCLAALVVGAGRASAAEAAPIPPEVPNVRQFGARGDGLHDDTAAFATALRQSAAIFAQAGAYLVSSIVVPAGRRIFTQGFSTVLRQRGGLPPGTPLLKIAGSDVRIGDLSLIGNIAEDAGEQRHGLLIQASGATGDLANIEVGNVQGTNLRGDLVYIGARDRRSVRNIRVGDVKGENIFRNVVSVCGGDNISIQRIEGTRVGYFHLDVEPDSWNGPVGRLSVAALQGGFVQVAGQTAMSAVEQVSVGTLDLQQPSAGSVPPYAAGGRLLDALTVRNVRSLNVRHLVVRGFSGHAIKQVYVRGELDDQSIAVAQAELSDCCRDRRIPPAYIQGDRRATRVLVDRLTVDIRRPEVSAIADCRAARVREARGRISPHGRLIRNSNGESLLQTFLRNGPPLLLAAAQEAGSLEAIGA